MDLVYLIEKQRQKMIDLGLTKGIDHKETIECSQLLDALIVQYQEHGNIKIHHFKYRLSA